MNKLYCCYSVQVRDYLYKNGVKYDICALNPNTNNMFWAYIRTERLDKLLNEWSSGKI